METRNVLISLVTVLCMFMAVSMLAERLELKREQFETETHELVSQPDDTRPVGEYGPVVPLHGFGSELAEAISRGDIDKAGRLIAEGERVDDEACHDESYLIVAARNGDVPMIRLLVERGACIDCQCMTDAGDGGTPLYHAAMWGHPEAVGELLALGADPNLDTEWGFTPLHIAAQNGNYDCVKILTEMGAKVVIPGGIDPAELARSNGHEDVALLLEGRD